MSTIVNTPATKEESSAATMLVGVLFTGIVIALFFIYGLPAIRSMTQSESATATTIEAEVLTPTAEPVEAEALAPTTTP